jgi:hypothetical protein
VSYLALGGLCIETPTYFVLEREHRVEHVPPGVTSRAHDP